MKCEKSRGCCSFTCLERAICAITAEIDLVALSVGGLREGRRYSGGYKRRTEYVLESKIKPRIAYPLTLCKTVMFSNGLQLRDLDTL